MALLKRLTVWLLEILCQALLLMMFLTFLGGLGEDSGQRNLADDLVIAFVATVVVFMVGSGYLVTTAICRVAWKSQNLWAYSAAAAVLFVVHEQFLFTGLSVPSVLNVQIQVAGACIAFICTFVGGWFLRGIETRI